MGLGRLGAFVGFLWRGLRWQLVTAAGAALVVSLLEGVSLAMVVPLLAVLGDAGRMAAAGPRTQMLFRGLGWLGVPRGGWLAAVLLLLLVSMALLAVLTGLLSSLTVRFVVRTRERLAGEVYGAMVYADWEYLVGRRSSDLTHYLQDELLRVGSVAAAVPALLANGLAAVLLLGVAAAVAPWLALVLGVGLGVLIPLERRAGRKAYGAGEELSRRMREVVESSVERVGHLKVVQAYGAEEAEVRMYAERLHRVGEQLIENEWRGNRSGRGFQLAVTGVLCGAILLAVGPLRMPTASLLVFLFAFLRAMPRLTTVQSKVKDVLVDLPAYGAIADFVEECGRHAGGGGEVVAPLSRGVTLDGVQFGYGAGPAVLRGVSLRLERGRVTAVAGLSGAGKSTVADLVLGLLFAEEGAVRVDGVALTRERARDWRGQVAYVSQDTLLFHATVRENLLWARPGATEGEMAEAIRAGRAEFCYGLAAGLETVVGDRGTMLSHGQRQRIALARALLRRPRLLILDEATNSLDLENEEAVLEAVPAGWTVLLISHRPSALMRADWVYVLEDGVVKAEGEWGTVRGLVEG